MNSFRRDSFVIGIDPGKKTGIAFYHRSKNKIIKTICGDFHTAYELIGADHGGSLHSIVIELPRTKAIWHKKAITRAAQDRTAVNVGSVIREAEILIERARMLGLKVITPHPMGKDGIDAEFIKRLTGYDGKPNNEHVRDAIMLCWGR